MNDNIQEPTSRLHGWDYIYSLMNPCKICGQKPTLARSANNEGWQVTCFNQCCGNFEQSIVTKGFGCIVDWNNKNKIKETQK
jgi:hypothetical protein